MALAIFDLDNTLLAGDSDYLWGQFLCDLGVVDKDFYERENDRFYHQYKAGSLDIYEFLSFSLRPLKENSTEDLMAWRTRFVQQEIESTILPPTTELIEKHRESGDTLLIITATNRFVTEPIAERLGVDHLIATEPEIKEGRYTGRVEGIPSFQDGKVERLSQWLTAQDLDLTGSTFYSDSHNDIALLEKVDNPVAVNPDEQLEAYASLRGWRIISLRN
ncbi:MAG: HAD family hydrolase [Gammaproteobacteria bacterium]|nr:HAD family hydrolase [Gammaproteobacteria bacterium]